MSIIHVPVMLEEVLEGLRIRRSGIYVDGTVGLAGHALAIVRKARECTLIGIDRDEAALEIAAQKLSGYRDVHLVRGNFADMRSIVSDLGFESVDGIVLDLGVSSLQLKSEGRGFSFLRDEPLDMRMDRSLKTTAADIVNTAPERELADIIWKYGEERCSRKIARAVVHSRRKARIYSCRDLSTIIERVCGRRGKIHPATRTFQALRIAVNREIEAISKVLYEGTGILGPGGRFCVLSYHSLEDRAVKNAFRDLAREGMFSVITRKPIIPGEEEQRLNPSSRSAKLRIGERL